MPKIDVDDVLLYEVVNYQKKHKIRSRGTAVAKLIEDGLALAIAQEGGFDLASVLKQQVIDGVAEMEQRLAAK